MTAKTIMLLALCVAFGASAATVDAASPASAASSGSGGSAVQARAVAGIVAAKTLLQAHRPAEAIAALDPVLAEYAQTHVVSLGVAGAEDAVYATDKDGAKRRIYGARSSPEVLAYMLTATTHHENAVAIDALWGNALALKGYALFDLRRQQDAEEALRTAVALSPMNAGYLIELGNVYMQERRWANASRVLDAAVEFAHLSPEATKLSDQTHAWRARAYLDVELDRLDEGEALYRKCLELDPTDTAAAGELQYIAKRRLLKAGPP